MGKAPGRTRASTACWASAVLSSTTGCFRRGKSTPRSSAQTAAQPASTTTYPSARSRMSAPGSWAAVPETGHFREHAYRDLPLLLGAALEWPPSLCSDRFGGSTSSRSAFRSKIAPLWACSPRQRQCLNDVPRSRVTRFFGMHAFLGAQRVYRRGADGDSRAVDSWETWTCTRTTTFVHLPSTRPNFLASGIPSSSRPSVAAYISACAWMCLQMPEQAVCCLIQYEGVCAPLQVYGCV